MKHKIIKGILFFVGLAMATAAMALFFPRVLISETFEMLDVFLMAVVGGAGVILAAFGLLVHAKDTRENEEGPERFLQGAGYILARDRRAEPDGRGCVACHFWVGST